VPFEFFGATLVLELESLEVITDFGPSDSFQKFQKRPHGRLQRRDDKLAAREKRF